MNSQELKYIRRIKNVLFCIDDDFVSYDDLLLGKYDEKLKIHMNTFAEEMISTLSPGAFQTIKRYIDIENELRETMFGLCPSNNPSKKSYKNSGD